MECDTVYFDGNLLTFLSNMLSTYLEIPEDLHGPCHMKLKSHN
jgi:hypothetical protein